MATIGRVSVENFLSFSKFAIELGPLNVLVGPNGTGKTNFLKIFQFLGEVARNDLSPTIEDFGGLDAIKFRGPAAHKTIKIHLQGLITPHASLGAPDEYTLNVWELRFRRHGEPDERRRAIARREEIVLKRTRGRGRRITLSGGKIEVTAIRPTSRTAKSPERLAVRPESSGLSTIRRLGDEYGATQVDDLAQVFEGLRLFEVDVEKARLPGLMENAERLAPNAANLASHLLWLREKHEHIFAQICEDVQFVLPSFEDFLFVPVGGAQSAVRVDIKEARLHGATPLGMASFGTIRAIALFAMLHDPDPPRLTCLEEVDHGLHPHALDRLVERLREASERTQIIAATHSPALVNRLEPEDLRIFERDQDTGASRLAEISLSDIISMQHESGYQLGELWFSGSLGGVLE
ncbi:AAA family ATPase [Inquilinus sp. Marseille-Q2685]|uniref:AAA family ATPase n=1 Tax=Inquilinus sp. Marseille-Q2685 TaxID=2866581 RepID=UPI001CE4131C|nr:AAA family ATPase [Inquilinus sp. Marseille-Q2685]